MTKETVAGVDWAGGQWLAVVFEDRSYAGCMLEDEFRTFWEDHDFDRIVVDIPIGLPEDEATNELRYNVDSSARTVTGRPNSVFSVPSREAARIAYEKGDLEEATTQNKSDLGKGITPPAYAILSSIGEVDSLLCTDEQARDSIIESHPEVCFRALHGAPLTHDKKTAAGVGERIEALERHLADPGAMVAGIAQELVGESDTVQIDDILDALVLGMTAWFSIEELFVLPDTVEDDPQGIPMRMAYWAESSLLDSE